MPMPRTVIAISQIVLGMVVGTSCLRANSLAIVALDGFNVGGVQSSLEQTGKFTAVDIISNPTLQALTPYDDVLFWTANPPTAGIGETLAAYYNLGGKGLVIAGFSFSVLNPIFAQPLLTGTIMTGADAGFAVPTDLSQPNTALPSGVLSLTAAGAADPIFSGIDLSQLTYDSSPLLANPQLAPGATLLATDGAGVDMIARSRSGVLDFNVYLPFNDFAGQPQLFDLIANSFPAAPQPPPPLVSEPVSLLLLGAGLGVLMLTPRKQ